jgi:DNA-binding MarR family transcriptional regulator
LKIGQVVFRLMEARLGDFGLRIRHYSLLETLAENGSTSQQDLGTYLRIDAATMVTTIDDLESLGYVARKRGTEDRRRYVVSILSGGEKMLGEMNDLMTELDGELFADLTDPQRRQLHGLMGKLSRGGTLIREFDEMRGR